MHAIPALPRGHYIGIDISQEMLRRLGTRVPGWKAGGTCRVSLLHQTTDAFPLEDSVADILCAFSVFTHMEHEDTCRYLRAARRVVRPGGRLVFSCLSMDTRLGREVFLDSAAVDVEMRWRNVRNVATTRDLMTEIARVAGWTMTGWYSGDDAAITLPGRNTPLAFGQSIGVLE